MSNLLGYHVSPLHDSRYIHEWMLQSWSISLLDISSKLSCANFGIQNFFRWCSRSSIINYFVDFNFQYYRLQILLFTKFLSVSRIALKVVFTSREVPQGWKWDDQREMVKQKCGVLHVPWGPQLFKIHPLCLTSTHWEHSPKISIKTFCSSR